MRWAVDPRLPRPLPDDPSGTVVTIGTFDGVHRGHWEVLNEVRRRAKRQGRRSVLLTFDPHPLAIVRPEFAPPMLTTAIEKKEILAESGLDFAVFLHFSPTLAEYSPRRFVEEILVGRLGVRELVVGYDHHFGKGRSGGTSTLRELGAELGFDVDVVGPVQALDSPISSTRIRNAILDGDMVSARDGLGRPYSIRGLVVKGDQRGRTLGFPTANLQVAGTGGLAGKLIPTPGIYAVRGTTRSRVLPGALHLGPRPTFQGAPPTIEVHFMDFDGDLYGEEIRIDFIRRLRGVEPFDSVQALIDQMRADVDLARRVLDEDEDGDEDGGE